MRSVSPNLFSLQKFYRTVIFVSSLESSSLSKLATCLLKPSWNTQQLFSTILRGILRTNCLFVSNSILKYRIVVQISLSEKLYLCLRYALHVSAKIQRTQRDDWYYRIKESFRDLTGRVRSRVMLNVGFIDEPHRPEDIRDIGKCLIYIQEH